MHACCYLLRLLINPLPTTTLRTHSNKALREIVNVVLIIDTYSDAAPACLPACCYPLRSATNQPVL
jgi:hypothetical protein